MIKLIAAIDEEFGIGKNNKLPWPESTQKMDLTWFKFATKGRIVVMGHNTYKSIGGALHDRINVVLTKTSQNIPGAITITEPQLILQYWKDADVYIIGGEQIYKEFLPIADEMILSRIPGKFSCDKFFPKFMTEDWLQHFTLNASLFQIQFYKRINYEKPVVRA